MSTLLEAHRLVKQLGGRRVVDGVDLRCDAFPLEHPVLVAVNLVNPLYHLAQAFRGLLLGGPVGASLTGVVALSAVMLAILVPLDLRLLRRRVLGE